MYLRWFVLRRGATYPSGRVRGGQLHLHDLGTLHHHLQPCQQDAPWRLRRKCHYQRSQDYRGTVVVDIRKFYRILMNIFIKT